MKEPLTPLIESAKIDSTPFVAHPRTTLEPNDRFQLSEGPYITTGSGKRTRFGEKGRFIYVGRCHQDDGTVVLVARSIGDLREVRIIWSRPTSGDVGLGNVTYRPYRIKKLC